MAGCVISNGSANSLTVASPLARRARIARRVGSAKAEKAESRFSPVFISITLYKYFITVKGRLIAGGLTFQRGVQEEPFVLGAKR